MNFNTERDSVTAAAEAAIFIHNRRSQPHHHHHPSHHHHIIPLPSYNSQPTIVVGVGSGGGGGGGGDGSGASAGDSSPKIMEWTNDDALELIEQYRCHTELWNRADPKYKDKLCRFRAWSEIAERFGCSKAEVERKMNVLLTQYRREKHKMFVKIYQGIQPNPSKWYAFKRFDFMEAGGGSLSGGGGGSNAGSGSNIVTNPAANTAHNGLNGLAAAAVAAAAYESSTIAAAGNGGASIGVGGGGAGAATAAAAGTTTTQPANQQHRRIKPKELKYFGAMGLNIPMLIAGSQTLDSWNSTGQYSPPIGSSGGGSDRGGASSQQQQQQLRVPLPMSYGNASSQYMGSGGGGGGSSSSDFHPSPHKTMDTSDTEDNNNKDEAAAAALGQLAAKVERRSPLSNSVGAGPGGGGGGSSTHEANEVGSEPIASLSEAGSSPIPNTNMHEAHKNHLLSSSSPAAGRASTPRQAHEQMHHSHTHHLQPQQQHAHPHLSTHGRQDDLDIKQELVDYFQSPAVGAPVAPPPPESHRSYSSAGEESRLQLDMAQDLRVAQAKAQASLANAFVLPPRSLDMPLNMRKLSAASSAAAAGHMLMNSLLNSRESMSEDGEADEATESAASPGHIKSSVSAQDAASSAAAAAAALYAESLNRDDCDFIGSNVSMKLRTMDRTQRIIAEKLISEVLYYGQFNELERTARIQPK